MWDGATEAELAEVWGVPRVEAFASIASTNDRALDLARRTGATPAVVVAEEQTAGRGRRGDSWRSDPGAGIWMSLLLADPPFPQLPLVVGVACAGAIERTMERAGRDAPAIRVKWPNDLLVDNRKLGGILCEAAGEGVVIGVGINVRAPEGGFRGELAESATALEVKGSRILYRKDMAATIIADILRALDTRDPFGGARAELARRDALTGRTVVTEQAGAGVARGIDADGALRLERADGGEVRVAGGSVRLTGVPGRG